MNASDELEQQCLFDLLVAVNGREEGFRHIVVESRVLSHFSNDVHLVLSEVGINLVPNQALVV